MTKPEIRHEGEDILLSWPDGIEAEVRDIQQWRDGPRAEVRVSSRLQEPGHLHQAMLNLMSSSSRDTFRRILHQRDPEVDWQAYLEQICILSVTAWRQGNPFLRIEPELRSQERAFAARPILPSGLPTIYFGDGGAGKSLFVQQLAGSLVQGEGFAGIYIDHPHNVGYLDWETDEADFSDRMARLGFGSGVWYRRCTAPLVQISRQIRREADQLGIEVFIIDSLGYAAGGDIREAETALAFFSAIHYLGRTSAIVHHIPKDSKEPYGSVYVRNSARSAWFLAQSTGDGGFGLAMVHRKANNTAKFDPIAFNVVFEDSSITFHRTDAKPALAEIGELRGKDLVLLTLQELGEMTLPDIADHMGSTKERVSVWLFRLRKEGRVSPAAHGVWKPL